MPPREPWPLEPLPVVLLVGVSSGGVMFFEHDQPPLVRWAQLPWGQTGGAD
jgi:hypothetical protein